MCSSSKPKMPDIPKPAPPPAPPPPPTETAKVVKNKGVQKRASTRNRGTSSLTMRRSSVNTGSSGSGAKINY